MGERGTHPWREIMEWHTSNGGNNGRPAGHAVRMFREVVELCIAAGASEEELKTAFNAEVFKANKRGEFRGVYDARAVPDEVGDVETTFEVFCTYNNVNRHIQTQRALQRCRVREWEADKDGVLWRPRKRPTAQEQGSGVRAPHLGQNRQTKTTGPQ